MKFVSFNVNSVRQRLHQLKALVDTHQPDVIGLQETKVQDHEFPTADLEALGYQVVFHGQKTHYGVATLSRLPIIASTKGFPDDDDTTQKRFIALDVETPDKRKLTVLNGYFPQGENIEHPSKYPNKRWFYQQVMAYLKTHCTPDDAVVVMGDMNISPSDLDIGIGEDNRKRWLKSGKCSFQAEERQWMDELYSWGLTDTYRHLNPECAEHFSWFDYRSRGFERSPKRGLRIDHILTTAPLLKKCTATGIDYDIRAMEKPSDHAPIWSEFEL